MNETLLQAVFNIADQIKMAENVGKTNCGNEELSFFSLLFLQVRSRRVEQVEGYSRYR